MDYTKLPLTEVWTALDDISRETARTFGGLDARQLNWRPDATRWSVAQCFEHLVKANDLMLRAAEDALEARNPRTIWQRLPVWPGVFGRMLIRSQSPATTKKFKAAAAAHPASSSIGADILARFVDQHAGAVARLRTLDEPAAARIVMTSPFVRVITYSVLDGLRLIAAHDRRHFEQARRVAQTEGFPAG